jgi:hypothetical protein
MDEVIRNIAYLVLILLVAITVKVGIQAGGNARRAENTARRVEEALEASDKRYTAKLDHILELVNSRLSEALTKIDRLEAQRYEETGQPPTGEPPPKREAERA